jgi:dipeptidyl aminopeptidase/acylaminoacyl peptidase
MLIVHGELDREVPVAHAERLATIAQKGDSKSVELVTVRGVNHRLLAAFTGEVSEYPTLTERTVSKDIATTVTGWLTKTLPAPAARGR